MAQQSDVIVIGMGPGGEHVAGRLADAGLDVVGVEAELLGGECPYWACVPTKMMVRAGNLLAEAGRLPGMAGSARVSADFAPVATRIRTDATTDWDDTSAVERFTAKGGNFVRGRGRLVGHGRVRVEGEHGGVEYGARLGVVLATGTTPVIPPIPGLAETPYWTNREAVSAESAPGSLIVLGGGAVGLEFAQAFARFGTVVTVIETHDLLLPQEEPEAARVVSEVLRSEGLDIRTGARADGVSHAAGQFTVSLEDDGQVIAEQLLVATGRRADLESLGVESVGLDPTTRTLAVDEQLLASPALWAVGDITGEGAFTHVAVYQAEIAARCILGDGERSADYTALPRVTFTDPEVGAVGLTERQAVEQGLRVRTGLAEVPSTARGWIHGPGNDGLIKLVEDADRGVLVGATSAGPMGGEVLSGLAVAVGAHVPVSALRDLIYAYPTFHRGIEDALVNLS